MNCGHYRTALLPRDLWPKTLVSTCVVFLLVMMLRVFYHSHECSDVNRGSHAKRPWTTLAYATERCDTQEFQIYLAIQCALFTVERRGCDIRKLQAQVGVIYWRFRRSIYHMTCLLFCFIPHLLNNPCLLFDMSSSHKSVTVRNQTPAQ